MNVRSFHLILQELHSALNNLKAVQYLPYPPNLLEVEGSSLTCSLKVASTVVQGCTIKKQSGKGDSCE